MRNGIPPEDKHDPKDTQHQTNNQQVRPTCREIALCHTYRINKRNYMHTASTLTPAGTWSPLPWARSCSCSLISRSRSGGRKSAWRRWRSVGPIFWRRLSHIRSCMRRRWEGRRGWWVRGCWRRLSWRGRCCRPSSRWRLLPEVAGWGGCTLCGWTLHVRRLIECCRGPCSSARPLGRRGCSRRRGSCLLIVRRCL